MREIVFDTETTGLSATGDRLVEIGCVELVNHMPTGRRYHTYLCPDCAMAPEAEAVHGLSLAFLADKPRFAEIADAFLEFVGDAPLIAHNAQFDYGFVNAELARLGRPPLDADRLVDSLLLARRRHPAGPNSLDALCLRYGIDISRRTLHGALLDASLLAEVYIELTVGRQAQLGLGQESGPADLAGMPLAAILPRPTTLPPRLGDAARQAHRALVASFGDKALWLNYMEITPAAAAE